MNAFRRRRRLELLGLGFGGAPTNSSAAAAVQAAEGALLAGFTNGSTQFCFYDDRNCEPCREDRPDCECIACETSWEDTMPYFDVDKAIMVGIKTETFLR